MVCIEPGVETPLPSECAGARPREHATQRQETHRRDDPQGGWRTGEVVVHPDNGEPDTLDDDAPACAAIDGLRPRALPLDEEKWGGPGCPACSKHAKEITRHRADCRTVASGARAVPGRRTATSRSAMLERQNSLICDRFVVRLPSLQHGRS